MDCPIFLSTPYIISGTDKATNFKFCMHILSIDRNKSTLQISGKVAGGVCEDSRLFRAPIYWAHRAVVFAIARFFVTFTLVFHYLTALGHKLHFIVK